MTRSCPRFCYAGRSHPRLVQRRPSASDDTSRRAAAGPSLGPSCHPLSPPPAPPRQMHPRRSLGPRTPASGRTPGSTPPRPSKTAQTRAGAGVDAAPTAEDCPAPAAEISATGTNAADHTLPVCPLRVRRHHPLARLHTCAVGRRHDIHAVCTHHRRENTQSVCPFSMCRQVPQDSRQTRAVKSSDAVTTSSPSGLTAAERTCSVCPFSMCKQVAAASGRHREDTAALGGLAGEADAHAESREGIAIRVHRWTTWYVRDWLCACPVKPESGSHLRT